MRDVLNRKKKTTATLLALFLSVLLYFFIPLCDSAYNILLRPLTGEMVALRLGVFPLAALVAYLSLKPKWNLKFPQLKFLALSAPLPLIISFIFGQLTHSPLSNETSFITYFWYFFCIPIGEELLFRGWAFEIFDRFFPNQKLTYLLPLSLTSWMTSLMFALWHFQNLQHNPMGLVLFQVVYTFFTGLWLAEIRIRCKNPLPCCIAHSLINLAATNWAVAGISRTTFN